MITIHKNYSGIIFHLKGVNLSTIALFDIETTGFVADKSFLYLIGCSYYENGTWQLTQWFAENPTEEITVLTSFLTFIKSKRVLIHYNGSTFDLPYLSKKIAAFSIDFQFDEFQSIDIYKYASSLKYMLELNSCTQNSVEKALGLYREDPYSGGELIQVYANFIGLSKLEQMQKGKKGITEVKALQSSKPQEDSKSLLHSLLLHNEEDLKGLQYILQLRTFDQLFDGNFTLENMELDESESICFTLRLQYSLPLNFHHTKGSVEIQGKDCICWIKIGLYEGCLRYYLKNYRDYYYLPYEHTIIHKSLGQSVDPKYREKATPQNCFIEKLSLFLPQFEKLVEPIFRAEQSSKDLFFECSDEFLQNENLLHTYLTCNIKYLLKR